jgi:hypothetical protein
LVPIDPELGAQGPSAPLCPLCMRAWPLVWVGTAVAPAPARIEALIAPDALGSSSVHSLAIPGFWGTPNF